MEAMALDRSISINKQMKNNNNNLKKKIQTHPHYHQQQHLPTNNMMIDHNFIQSNKDIDLMLMKINMMHGHNNNYHGHMHGGVFLNPHANYPLFYRSTSLPPQHHHQPPPLLPLPAAAKPSFSSLPPPIRRRSSLSPPSGPTTNKKPTKKPQHVGKKSAAKVNEGDVDPCNKRVGPDPDEIFSLSPPPSSLPLPRFSLRQPKRSCTAEAAVVDDGGVADNLSRILRIR